MDAAKSLCEATGLKQNLEGINPSTAASASAAQLDRHARFPPHFSPDQRQPLCERIWEPMACWGRGLALEGGLHATAQRQRLHTCLSQSPSAVLIWQKDRGGSVPDREATAPPAGGGGGGGGVSIHFTSGNSRSDGCTCAAAGGSAGMLSAVARACERGRDESVRSPRREHTGAHGRGLMASTAYTMYLSRGAGGPYLHCRHFRRPDCPCSLQALDLRCPGRGGPL